MTWSPLGTDPSFFQACALVSFFGSTSVFAGDGVMFVWRLSSELQQSMRDRMCELRPGGETPVSGVGGVGGGSSLGATGDRGRDIGTAVPSGTATTEAETAAADIGAGIAVSLVLPANFVGISISRWLLWIPSAVAGTNRSFVLWVDKFNGFLS